MRALWITHVYPRDSTDLQGLFLHRLAKELPPRGIQVQVLAPGASGAGDSSVLDGIEVKRFRYAAEKDMTLAYTGEMHREALRNPFRFMQLMNAMMRGARREIARTKPDLIHAHWWFPAGLSCRTTAEQGRPLVLSLHGTDMRLLRRSILPWPLARWVINGCDRVLAVSRAISEDVRRLHLRDRPCDILPMPADAEVFRERLQVDASVPSFVLPARLVTQKRIDVVIRAVAWARDQGIAMTVHVVGEGKEKARLMELSRMLQVADHLVFHGFVSQEVLAQLLGPQWE